MAATWISAKEAALQLGEVSPATVYKLFRLGELEGIKVAGAVRIRQASVDSYMEEHTNQKPRKATPPRRKVVRLQPMDYVELVEEE